jgi:asparagine synthase (glutamine-hydrolysing)
MCGIAGIFHPRDLAAPTADDLARRLTAMSDAMAHRGPDGDGIWTAPDGRIGFGHRRLAIIDLSPDAAQPMTNADGSVHITYNGEIYNHAALRAELERLGHRFRTDHSDTEVLVHGYSQWGLDGLVERLEGMFAFAIWDAPNRRLSLARDRVGIKPIYFTRRGGAFRFASEIKAILTEPDVPRAVDAHALGHYLSFMVAPAPLTLFKGIYKLPAGHVMEIEADGRARARRYWNAVPGRSPAAALAGNPDRGRLYAAGVRERLAAAIEKRMMSDVPFGVFLSGGIDSSANVALMSEVSNRPVETFTVGFKDHRHLNELDYANLVAERFKTNHHEVLIDGADMQGYLADLVHHQDEPIADWVCVPLYFVSKLAKDSGVTVVQVGEGSDEQFCGYDSWMKYLGMYRRFWRPYTAATPKPLRAAIGAFAGRLAPTSRGGAAQAAEALLRAGQGHALFWSGANAFWNVHKARVLDAVGEAPDWSDIADMGFDMAGLASNDSGDVADGYFAALAADHPDCDQLTRMIHAEFRQRLPELLLMRVDKVTMSTSIEGRVPFLDHAMVEYTMDIPMADKVAGGVKKALLKQAVAGLLPDEIVNRPKMGFAAPVADWMRGNFGAAAEADVLKSPLVADGPLKRDYVARLFREHRTGAADHALHLWTINNLTAWHAHWIQ